MCLLCGWQRRHVALRCRRHFPLIRGSAGRFQRSRTAASAGSATAPHLTPSLSSFSPKPLGPTSTHSASSVWISRHRRMLPSKSFSTRSWIIPSPLSTLRESPLPTAPTRSRGNLADSGSIRTTSFHFSSVARGISSVFRSTNPAMYCSGFSPLAVAFPQSIRVVAHVRAPFNERRCSKIPSSPRGQVGQCWSILECRNPKA